MIIEFATKRDVNGNRYYLGFDTDKKVFSRERGKWYGRDDIIEINKADRRKLIDSLEADGFEEYGRKFGLIKEFRENGIL